MSLQLVHVIQGEIRHWSSASSLKYAWSQARHPLKEEQPSPKSSSLKVETLLLLKKMEPSLLSKIIVIFLPLFPFSRPSRSHQIKTKTSFSKPHFCMKRMLVIGFQRLLKRNAKNNGFLLGSYTCILESKMVELKDFGPLKWSIMDPKNCQKDPCTSKTGPFRTQRLVHFGLKK